MKPVIVTVDTEGHVGNDPFLRLVLGDTGMGHYGIEYIMDLFDEVQARVLFFVDFAAAWDYGVDQVEKVVRLILERGHDVGVHIHPDHMGDKSRPFLWQYSREEQYDLIARCTELYHKVTGRRPKSFRAGKYGANRDTLDILCELGYQYDFSQFYHQKWCGIEPPITINAPCQYKQLTEFPVTMHRSFSLFSFVREDKLDVEQMTISEMRYALKQVAKQPFSMVATLFLHSFSLIDWFDSPDAVKPNPVKIEKCRQAIKAVCDHADLCFVSEADLSTIQVEETRIALKSDIVWHNNLRGGIYTFIKAKNIAKRNRKARLFVYAASGLGVIAALCVLLAVCLLFFS